MKRKDMFEFLFLFLFTCCIFSSYLIKHFSSDSFIITNLGYKGYAINYSFLDGRPLMGSISLIADKFNVPILMFNRILLLLGLIVSVIAVIKLKKLVLEYKKIDSKFGNVVLLVACYYTIFHFCYFDNLYFAEAFVMAISVLGYIVAADFIVRGRKYVKALLVLIASVMSYQATISMFFICIILFSFLKDTNYKEVFKNFLVAVVFGLIAVGINVGEIVIIQNIFGITQTRIGSNIFLNIIQLTFYMGSVIVCTGQLFPACLYVIFVLIAQILIYYKIIKYNRCKKGGDILTEQLVLIILCIVFSFIPSILSLTAFDSGRLRFSIGATIGILFIHMISKADILDVKIGVNKVLILLLIIYGLCNSINYISLININKYMNELDQKNTYKIGEYINEYEKQNNIQVKKIAVIYKTDNIRKYYKGQDSRKVGVGISAIRTEWAAEGVIEYYTGRKFDRADISIEEKQLYLEMVDEDKGYMCLGDTLYVSVYQI